MRKSAQTHLASTDSNIWSDSGRKHSSPGIILLCSHPSKVKETEKTQTGVTVLWEHPCRWHFWEWGSSDFTTTQANHPPGLPSLCKPLLNHSDSNWPPGGARLRNSGTYKPTGSASQSQNNVVGTPNTRGVSSGASRDYYYQDLWAEWLSYTFTLCIQSLTPSVTNNVESSLLWFQNVIHGMLTD